MPTDPSTKLRTNFTQIIFNQASHSYTYHGQPLTPVSRIVSQLKPPFDREGIAARTATRRGVGVATVLAEWDKARDVSMARGTRVHEYIARKLTGKAEPPQTDMFLALNQQLAEMDAFDRFWVATPDVGHPAEQVEWVIGDAELGIAGTVDAILRGDPGILHIFDWKTGKEFKTENRFQKLLPPFDDLDDCDLSSYSLQLSLYRLIVQRNIDNELGDSYIVHLTSDGEYIIHKALDLRERLMDYLTQR